jgi:hypothetical protein
MDWTAEEMGFDYRQGKTIFLYFTASRQAPMGNSVSQGLKLLEREADHPLLNSAELKNCGVIPPVPHNSSWRGA